jgi:hypothetical protein
LILLPSDRDRGVPDGHNSRDVPAMASFWRNSLALASGDETIEQSGTPHQCGPCSIGFPPFCDFVTDFLQHASPLPIVNLMRRQGVRENFPALS